ncbi:hypothetical protein AL00_19270 [Sphingobium indicum F2]|uniref:Type I restriction modification DNA specificity domain-containing protein n=2 Tax=Sphingomonadaceae TaxID=41297 RepID=A0A8E0WPE6_9SPHN|nr:hypothetical protein AL00_19270 [Sphingobium indicum F2]
MSSKVRTGAQPTPFLRTSNVFWDRIDLSKVDEMPMQPWEREDKSLRPGDLLVCEGGEIGRAAVWEGQAEGVSFQNHVHRLRRKSDDVDPGFYAYFLQSAFTQLGIYEGAGNKTTIPNLSRSNLAALDVPKPDFDEQRNIRLVLKRVRRTMDLADNMVRVADELKRAAMHELFARGLRGEPQKDSEIGPIPESWEIKTLLEICTISSGGTPRKSVAEYWNGDIPWVSGKDLKKPTLDDAIDHISEDGAAVGSKIAPSDTVLILVRGMGLAKDLPISRISRPMAFNQDLKALISKGEVTGAFLRSAIYNRKDALLSRIVPSAHGTMTLNLDDLESFKIGCPTDPDEISGITATIDAIDAKIDLHKRKKAVLEELFRSLLHRLMTGEIRVADLNLTALEANQQVAA